MSSLFIHHRREKLLNAIAYFVGNTKYCHTLKLFKLLNFLDFEHYRQTGRSVTGLSYHAFSSDPLARALYDEIKEETEDEIPAWGVKKTLVGIKIFDGITEVLIHEFTTNNDFDETYFTPRELEIMGRLVLFYGDEVKADFTPIYSHPEPQWAKAWPMDFTYADILAMPDRLGYLLAINPRTKGGGDSTIPYELALQAEPIVQSEPTIEEEDIQMLDEVFQGMELR